MRVCTRGAALGDAFGAARREVATGCVPVYTGPHDLGGVQMNQTIRSPDSDTTSHGVRVRASAQFVPELSDTERGSYVYSYRINIENVGDRRVKLLRRHWIIVDAHGERDDVEGPGVVGEYPELAPGESYEYVSRCPLATRWGTMEGSYTFKDLDGDEFKVRIGRFFLVPSAAGH
jgi:ApaG protein